MERSKASLPDTALRRGLARQQFLVCQGPACPDIHLRDRKSTRLNSSHLVISYAVSCLTKKTRLRTLLTAPRPDNRRTMAHFPVPHPVHHHRTILYLGSISLDSLASTADPLRAPQPQTD